MTWRGRSVLAVVPARGGSKGIPRKNLCLVGGRSLVAHAAEIVKQLPWLDAAVLSTDDPEIVREGARCGLEAPFLRPKELASDNALGVDAWRHAWLMSEASHERQFDCSVLLQPTSPLRRPGDVEGALERMLNGNHSAAATVSRVPGHYVPEKMLRIDNGILSFLHPEGARHSNRPLRATSAMASVMRQCAMPWSPQDRSWSEIALRSSRKATLRTSTSRSIWPSPTIWSHTPASAIDCYSQRLLRHDPSTGLRLGLSLEADGPHRGP